MNSSNLNSSKLQNKYENLLGHIWSSGSKLFFFNQKMSYNIQYYVCSIFAKDEKLLPENLKSTGKRLIMTLKQTFRDLIAAKSFTTSRKEYEQMLLSYFNLVKKEEKANGFTLELAEKYRILYDAVVVLELYPGAYNDKMKEFQNNCLKRSEDIKKALKTSIISPQNTQNQPISPQQQNPMQNQQNYQYTPQLLTPNPNANSKQFTNKVSTQFMRAGTYAAPTPIENETTGQGEFIGKSKSFNMRSNSSPCQFASMEKKYYNNVKYNQFNLNEENLYMNKDAIKELNLWAIGQIKKGNIEDAMHTLKKSLLYSNSLEK